MDIFALTIYAKQGHEDDVAGLFDDLGKRLEGTSGFKGRHVLRARTGELRERVTKGDAEPAAGAAGHAAPAPDGTHFINIEMWEAAEDRTAFSKSEPGKEWAASIKPHLLPEHTHDLYNDISGAH